MALPIGDAVLTFVGDTTQLDQAFATIPAKADAAMSAAAGSVDQVGEALKGLSFELDATGSNAAYAGGEIKEAMREASVSTREARGEVALLGEAFGIRLPRHVRSFVAELPGVGTALSAAFSATAIYFLIEALIQGAEKLSTFIADTFIYTQAAKESAEAQTVLNQKFIENAAAIDKAKQALETYGFTGLQRTQKAIEDHSKSLTDNTAKIEANKLKIAQLAAEQQASEEAAAELGAAIASVPFAANTEQAIDNTAAIQNLRNENALLAKGMEALAIEIKVLNLQLRDEEDAARKSSLQKRTAYGEALISGTKTVGNALLAVQKAQAEAAVVFDGSSASRRIAIEKDFAEQEYQLTLSSARARAALVQQAENQTYEIERANLENRLSVQKSMGAAGIEAVKATQIQIEELGKAHGLKLATEWTKSNSEIEALQKNHNAKMISEANKLKVDFDLIDAEIQRSALARGLFPSLPQDTRNVISFNEAAAKLGVTLTADVAKNTQEAKAALVLLNAEFGIGKISLHDLLSAEIAVRQQQLLLNKSMGDVSGVKAMEKEIDALTKKLQALEGETKKGKSVWDAFSTDFKKKAKDNGTASEQMGQVFAATAMQMQKAFESAISAAILSEDSFGAALEKATAQILAQLAAQAAVKAIYYTAEGIAAATVGDPEAGGFFAAAAEMALVGVAAGVTAHAMAGAGGGGSSGNNAGTNAGITPSKATATQPNPVQTINTLSLGGGGLASQPTFAIIGDSANGAEAVIPLENTRALNAIAMALVPALVRAMNNQPSGRGGINPSALLSSGTLQAAARVSRFSSTQSAAANSERDAKLLAQALSTAAAANSEHDAKLLAQALSTAFEGKMGGGQIHIQIESDIPQLVKKINHSVSTGRTRLLASDSMRLTKRT